MFATDCSHPTDTRQRKGTPEQLRYAITPCPLGLLLMAASDRGLCALLFADDEQALIDELQARFPAGELQRDQAGLQEWLDAVLTQLQDPSRRADLPLDLRGSAFQQRVWQTLQTIEPGKTMRYGELAATLGSHARAVARACASNPIGLLVPCHRVVGADQAVTGYRWGVARKSALLAAERKSAGA
jgi:AraC family transcriptional regulator of adaptative response/methylated-DNA-[protein]-cysteine methyltransferase